jgi:hypothetical protein
MGHAVRSAVVANSLNERHMVSFVSPVSSSFLSETVLGPFEHRARTLDVGVVQTTPFTIDVPLTLERLNAIQVQEQRILDEECAWLREMEVDAVLTDIPSLACAAASTVGVPCIAVANFSWDDIYRGYGQAEPEFDRAAAHIAQQYAQASLLLELPFATPMPAFARRRKMGLVARRASLSGRAVRAALGIEARFVAVMAFNGSVLDQVDGWNVPDGWQIICPYASSVHMRSNSVRSISREDMALAGIRFPDLVAAADVVISKPGYGITSECIANDAALLYTDRGSFVEWDYIVASLKNNLPSAYISVAKLLSGNIRDSLKEFESPRVRAGRLRPLSDGEICQVVESALAVSR